LAALGYTTVGARARALLRLVRAEDDGTGRCNSWGAGAVAAVGDTAVEAQAV